MIEFNSYSDCVYRHNLYLYNHHGKPTIVQVITTPESWDDITYEFYYASPSGGDKYAGNSRHITHRFTQTTLDDIRNSYPELFI